MRELLYERPREKLVMKGVSSLKMVELIQILVGSGSAAMSSASIAQHIGKLIETQSPSGITYEQLLSVAGIGHAKACLILAAIEVGGRVHYGSSMYASSS